MILDNNKKNTNIKYNHLNLPLKITFSGTNKFIDYLYRADGSKIMKKVTDGTNLTSTDYLTGFQYVNTFLQFFPHAEGYVQNSVQRNGDNLMSYVYNHTDHLGNVCLSYSDKNKDGFVADYWLKDPYCSQVSTYPGQNGCRWDYISETIEENNYYPFGLKHKGYNDNNYSNGYKYKYNGKELQDELGLNVTSMDFRNYDNAIGRFSVQDPVIHHSLSPYQAFNLNPVFWSDPSGMSGEHYNWQTGKYEDDKGNAVSYEDTMASHGMNSSGNPLDDITVNSSGMVTNVKETNNPNRFFDEQGNQLFFNDPNGEDKEMLEKEFFFGDYIYRNVSKSDVLWQIGKVLQNPYIMESRKIGSYFVSYLLIAAASHGQADFAFQYLNKLKTENDEYANYFRFGNNNTIYNTMDGGNFMWGAWTKFLGLKDFETYIGSNINEFYRLGDDNADQKAIFNGRKSVNTFKY